MMWKSRTGKRGLTGGHGAEIWIITGMWLENLSLQIWMSHSCRPQDKTRSKVCPCSWVNKIKTVNKIQEVFHKRLLVAANMNIQRFTGRSGMIWPVVSFYTNSANDYTLHVVFTYFYSTFVFFIIRVMTLLLQTIKTKIIWLMLIHYR